MILILTKNSYLTAIPWSPNTTQHQAPIFRIRIGDSIRQIIFCRRDDYILFFTSLGKVYRATAAQFESRNEPEFYGHFLGKLFWKINRQQEEIVSMIRTSSSDYNNSSFFLIFVTKHGKAKRVQMNNLKYVKWEGKLVTSMPKWQPFDRNSRPLVDELAFVLKARNESRICLISAPVPNSHPSNKNRLLGTHQKFDLQTMNELGFSSIQDINSRWTRLMYVPYDVPVRWADTDFYGDRLCFMYDDGIVQEFDTDDGNNEIINRLHSNRSVKAIGDVLSIFWVSSGDKLFGMNASYHNQLIDVGNEKYRYFKHVLSVADSNNKLILCGRFSDREMDGCYD